MKSFLGFMIFIFTLPLMGQVSVYVFPQKQQIPVNGIQTFTAVVTGADDKGIAWTTTCGSIIKGLNSTIGLKNSTEQSCTVTATSSADKTKTATGTVSYVATPHFQEGVHPRLILTPKMVEIMRTHGWATAANPYWKDGLSKSAANAIAETDAKWCFSFGGNCSQGTKPGQPVHSYDATLSSPPAIAQLSRDSSGTVTVTTASAFNIWRGATVTINPNAEDQASFKKATVVVTSVADATHFTYKEGGGAAVSTANGSLGVSCGKLNTDMWCEAGGYKSPIFDATETYTQLFAFLSLIDPDPTSQAHYRIRAHDMMMWMVNLAGDLNLQNCIPNGHFVPFQNCNFPTNDRAHQVGMEAFPLTVDWIYSSFTPSERKSITRLFRFWTHQTFTTGPTGVLYPLPVGVINSPALLSQPKSLRWQMNNLGNSQYRAATMLSLVMDAVDDPPDDGAPASRIIPSKDDVQTSTLRDYSLLVTGAWTYIHWAVAEDPGVVASALGVSPAGMGENQGGLSPEGSEYGPNYGYIAMALLSLHTAGADDPTHMPQMSFISSSHWDLWIDGLLNIMSPATKNDKTGSYYETTQFGDEGAGNVFSGSYLKLFMPLGLYDYYTGENPARLNAIRWLVKHAIAGGCGSIGNAECGPSNEFLHKRLVGTFGTNNFSGPIYTFLLLDPSATPTSPTNPSGDVDPRPQYPTEFYAPGHHEMSSRTDWKPDATWLVTHCSWTGIDHQRGNCGQTELYRKGRWLTKAHATYTNRIGASTIFNNSGITIGNPDGSPKIGDAYSISASLGAQYDAQGAGGFTPTPSFSSGPSFVYEYMDQTDAHNENNPSHHPTHDVAHASRTILWLKPDILVYYDRGVSHSAGMFKRDNFNFTAEPIVTGQMVRVEDAVNKEQTFLTTLLPLAADFSGTVCAYGTSNGACTGGDPSHKGDEAAFLYQIEDKSMPLSAQFLSVLEGADAGASRIPTSLVQSTGTPMDGAVVGNTVVLFTKVPWRTDVNFVSSSYSVPSTVINHYIGGLQPGTNYGVDEKVAGGNLELTVAKQCAAKCITTDDAGLLVFNASSGNVTSGAKPYSRTAR